MWDRECFGNVFFSEVSMTFFLTSLLPIFLAVVVFMHLAFALSLLRKRNDVADVAWGLGIIVTVVMAMLITSAYDGRSIVILMLIFVWGGRLATHIFLRNRGKSEDFRYKEWREKWGENVILKSYLQVFLLQGVLLLVVSFPAYLAIVFPGSSLGSIDLVGVAVWILGFFFESVGDMQLAMFKADPTNKGKILQTGLWRYSRHPNYFGEITMWWGIFLIALSSEFGFFGIIGPLAITFFIIKVSGIPLAEKHYEGNEEFAQYAAKTSILFPKFW